MIVTTTQKPVKSLRIRIEGASSPFPADRFAAGLEVLRAAGHVVDDSHAGPRGRHPYLNGTDDERRLSLEEALMSDVDVVLLARGGYGLTRIVDALFVDGWPMKLPRVVGFSDVTALFGKMASEGLLDRCVHGPVVTSLAGEPDDSRARFFDAIAGGAPADIDLDVVVADTDAVEGPLFAGNLVVLAALCGTPSMPSLRGHVVVVEEVGERPYRLDRLLTQLINSGAFAGVAAVVVGHLTGCDEPASATNNPARDPVPSGRDVVIDGLRGLGVPVFAGAPVGHEAPNIALPLGGRVLVEVDGARARLRFR